MTQSELFSKLEKQYKLGLPFVIIRYPNSTKIKAILQKDTQLHTIDSFKETGFVFAPFTTKEPLVIIPFNDSEVIEVFFEEELDASSNYDEAESKSHQYKKQHLELVKKGILAIEDRKFKKVVLSRCEHIALKEPNLITLYKRLLHSSAAFVYGFYHPKVGEWVGATPEVLLHLENNKLHTMALAGTKLANAVWTRKEVDEQQIVTDFIVECITPFVKEIELSKPETINAGNVQHLKTIITANLKTEGTSLKSLINQLHPTPAICGLPKEKAQQFILKNENYNREFYTGFLGELNVEGKTNLFVNLRCMQLKNNEVLIYVGGGVTKASIAENEWEETVRKTKAMQSILWCN